MTFSFQNFNFRGDFNITTPVGGAAAPSDPYFKYVAMLLHGNGTNTSQNNTFIDSSTNNFTITRGGTATQGSFSPYDTTWSNYFIRASSQYLTVSNAGSQFTFGTGAFTIECWVNLASMPSGTGYPTSFWMFGGGPVNSNPGMDFYINSTQIGFNLVDFTAPTAIGNHGITTGGWYHIAVVRGGTSNQTVSIYVNGTRVATASSVTATADPALTGIAISAAEPSGATGGNFDGYISNFRIVKGAAVYDPTQTTITVPTTALTAISGTSLLTCQSNQFIDNSTNAFTITPAGTPAVQSFSPFAPTTAYSTSTISGSAYFNGSGNYLNFPSNSAFSFATGDFTIEAWVYPTAAHTGAGMVIFDSRDTYNTYNGINMWLRGSTNVLTFSTNGNQEYAGSLTAPVNTWTHVAVVKTSGIIKSYVNGVLSTTFSYATSLTDTSAMIGRSTDTNTSYYFEGYISDARVVKGTAVYTSAFTPTTTPLTAISGTSLLLNGTNAGIYDNAMMNDLITAGTAQISTTQSKFGGSSIYLAGAGNYLSIPHSSALNFGTGNFTIETWIYYNSLSNIPFLFQKMSGTTGWFIEIGTSTVYFGWGSASSSQYIAFSTSLSTGVWYHIAVTRTGSTLNAFVNGVSPGAQTLTSADSSYDNTVNATIGGYYAGTSTYDLNGYIDDFRITKGNVRYTSNFTPPTAPFPDIGP